jgi:hypothetical protein
VPSDLGTEHEEALVARARSFGDIRELPSGRYQARYGSTKITDGDLTPLAGLPCLADLRITSRRAYRPTVEQLQARISHRW